MKSRPGACSLFFRSNTFSLSGRGLDVAMNISPYPTMKNNLFPTKAPNFIGFIICLALYVALMAWTGPATAQPAVSRPGDGSISHKPRIIVTTDLGADPDDDPRPVWVQFWGGGNNLAQATYGHPKPRPVRSCLPGYEMGNGR